MFYIIEVNVKIFFRVIIGVKMLGLKWKMENVLKIFIFFVLILMEFLINDFFVNILRCICLLGIKYEKLEKLLK